MLPFLKIGFHTTPASLGLQYKDITFPSRDDHLQLRGWGVSLGVGTLLMAAAQEPALRAIVSDSAYADILPSLQRKIPEQGHLPSLFTPGGFVAARVLYGIDYTNIRPMDSIASIAPRPIFLIQGSKDSWILPSQLNTLATAARTAPDANVQTWLVPGADHAQSFHTEGEVYVERVVAFYTAALGPDIGFRSEYMFGRLFEAYIVSANRLLIDSPL